MKTTLCFECGIRADHDHHVVPKSLGGTKTIPLCESCHGKAHGSRSMFFLRRKVKARKIARGEDPGSMPYGYTLDSSANWIENEEEQRIIRVIVELRDSGKTFSEIANALNGAGEVTQMKREWKWYTVRQILEQRGHSSLQKKKKIPDLFFERLQELRHEGLPWREVAHHLRREGFKNVYGEPWSDEGVYRYGKLRVPGKTENNRRAEQVVREMVEDGRTYREIADYLNKQHLKSANGLLWDQKRVQYTAKKKLGLVRPLAPARPA